MGAFNIRLKEAMGRYGFTQKALSERIGVNRQRVGQLLEYQDIPPAMDAVVKASVALGVSLDWLLLGKEVDPADELARMIRKLPEDQVRLLRSQVEGWLALARNESRESSG